MGVLQALPHSLDGTCRELRAPGNEHIPGGSGPGQGQAFLHGDCGGGVFLAAHGLGHAEDVAGVDVTDDDLLTVGGDLYDFEPAIKQHEKLACVLSLVECRFAFKQPAHARVLQNRIQIGIRQIAEHVVVLQKRTAQRWLRHTLPLSYVSKRCLHAILPPAACGDAAGKRRGTGMLAPWGRGGAFPVLSKGFREFISFLVCAGAKNASSCTSVMEVSCLKPQREQANAYISPCISRCSTSCTDSRRSGVMRFRRYSRADQCGPGHAAVYTRP